MAPPQNRESPAHGCMSPVPQAHAEPNAANCPSSIPGSVQSQGAESQGITASDFGMAWELEQERQRSHTLELQVQKLNAQVDFLGRQVEIEAQKTKLAQQKAGVFEEQRARFTKELEHERLRAQRLEENFGNLNQTVELLTHQAQESFLKPTPSASCVSDDHLVDGEDTQQSRMRDLERQLTAALSRADQADQSLQAKEAECSRVRQELRTVYAESEEVEALYEELNGRMDKCINRGLLDNGLLSDKNHEQYRHMNHDGAECRISELESRVQSLLGENNALITRVSVAEARSEALSRDKECLAMEVMRAMSSLADQKRDLESKLSINLPYSNSAVDSSNGSQCCGPSRPLSVDVGRDTENRTIGDAE